MNTKDTAINLWQWNHHHPRTIYTINWISSLCNLQFDNAEEKGKCVLCSVAQGDPSLSGGKAALVPTDSFESKNTFYMICTNYIKNLNKYVHIINCTNTFDNSNKSISLSLSQDEQLAALVPTGTCENTMARITRANNGKIESAG